MIRTRLLSETDHFPHLKARVDALSLADQMPHILLETRRITNIINGGLHGRRQAGTGEDFWQFRPFANGEPASRIDWRRSARDDRLYVREREWQARHTFWMWFDRSRSMRFSSSLAQTSKIERALVLGLALAHILATNGECVGYLGSSSARSSRTIIEFLAEQILMDKEGQERDLPPDCTIPARNELLLFGDFLSPLDQLNDMIEKASAYHVRGHVVLIIDPVEETFPFQGQTILREPETHTSLRIGDAANWRSLYQERILLHRQSFSEILKAKGWTLTLHHTDCSASETALHVLSLLSAAHRPAAYEV